MESYKRKNISDFTIIGINYRKTQASIRGQFAINKEQYATLLNTAKERGLDELFILSTCNRTEIYGFAQHPDQLIDLLCTQTEGDKNTFKELSYRHTGMSAVEHLFRVGAGLDSQILGDYEIVGQIKQAAAFAKDNGFTGAMLERLVNSTLQSSKAVKNQTALSNGTVSVAFAAIKYIQQHIAKTADKKYLLLGTGKIGSNACKNLITYLGAKDITLINRTRDNAATLAEELGLKHAPINDLQNQVNNADIILVASAATDPIITKEHLQHNGSKLLIDLSVPNNIATNVRDLEGIKLVNIDELSRIKDETLLQRVGEIPKANAVIAHHLGEFNEWLGTRRYAPVLQSMKHHLQLLQSDNAWEMLMAEPAPGTIRQCPMRKIQKVIDTLAVKMQKENTIGCHCIAAFNDYLGSPAL